MVKSKNSPEKENTTISLKKHLQIPFSQGFS